MTKLSRAMVPVFGLCIGLASCDTPTEADASAREPLRLSEHDDEDDVIHVARGKGRYLIQNVFDSEFSFVVKQFADGEVSGRFRELLLIDGKTVDFRGEVICLAFDLVNRRAWVGAVITENRSTHPDFHQWYHQPGQDVWFRVVDYGKRGTPAPDRRTFLGFENTPGIPTSQVYCDLRIWPDGDARTWPVTKGDISVKATDEDDDDSDSDSDSDSD